MTLFGGNGRLRRTPRSVCPVTLERRLSFGRTFRPTTTSNWQRMPGVPRLPIASGHITPPNHPLHTITCRVCLDQSQQVCQWHFVSAEGFTPTVCAKCVPALQN